MRMKGIGSINREALKEAKKRMRAVIDRTVSIGISGTAQVILEYARKTAEYHNVTGNTMASLTCGVYHNGELVSMSQPFEGEAKRQTLVEGEKYEVEEGNVYVAETGTEHYYGNERAADFLLGYQPSRNGWAVVFCTGTEYSTYLEVEKDLNVLTETSDYVRKMGVSIIGGKLRFAKAEEVGELPFPMPDDMEVPF